MPQPKKHPSAAAKQRAYRQRLETAFVASLGPLPLPKVSAIKAIPSSARWRAMRDQAQKLLSMLQTEMEEYQADRTDTWQESERGEAFQERLDLLATILDELSEIP